MVNVSVTRRRATTKRLKAVTSSKRTNWCTPAPLLELVRQLGPIGLDPCSNAQSIVKARVELRLDRGENGLRTAWEPLLLPGELVYCNPPYGKSLGRWMSACAAMWEYHRRTVVSLVPARVDRGCFQDFGAPPASMAVCFWRARLRFIDGDTGKLTDSATFPSAICYYGAEPNRFEEIFQEREDANGKRTGGSIWRCLDGWLDELGKPEAVLEERRNETVQLPTGSYTTCPDHIPARHDPVGR